MSLLMRKCCLATLLTPLGGLYAQATNLDGYVLIVAVVDGAPWEALALSSRAPTVLGGWHSCAICGNVFKSWDEAPCEICGTIKCPDCGRCDCPSRVVERKCVSCNMIKPAQFFVTDNLICIDC